MSRTTLDLDPTILRELRERAAREGKSMGTVASELLAQQLATEPSGHEPLDWISADLGTPYIDLEDKDAVAAVLDGRA